MIHTEIKKHLLTRYKSDRQPLHVNFIIFHQFHLYCSADQLIIRFCFEMLVGCAMDTLLPIRQENIGVMLLFYL